ncbi:permease [Rothia koreensis]|uniref:permease n=1 Tax=Rothia koreensis TaxID=592378 RepID=UPI0037C56EAC
MNLLFLRKTFSDPATWALPVVAFMLTSAMAYTVVGGVSFLLHDESSNQLFYMLCAALAAILLAVPMSSLMSSAARLMARQRERRLSTLRLLGASGLKLRALSLTESGTLAVTGIVLGAVLYGLLTPLVGLVHLTGHAIGASGLWLGFEGLLGVGILLLALALVSALSGLSRLEITPLSVRSRELPRRVRWIRLVAGGLLIFVALVCSVAVSSGLGGAMVFAFIVISLSIPLIAVNLLGPLVLKWIGTADAKTARSAERLIAARNLLESPQEMWRQIGSIAFSVYMAVMLGSGVAMSMAGSTADADRQDLILVHDVRTGVLVTLVMSFLMVAFSVGINQTAQVLDRQEMYRALSRMGMSIDRLGRVRRLSVMRPLVLVVIISGLVAVVTLFPLVGAGLVAQPVTMAVIAAAIVFGICTVWAACASTTPVLRRTLED